MMKVQYIANDGKAFDTEADCRAHEDQAWRKLLLKLKPEDLEAALGRQNVPLADALEKAGRLCGEARRKAGLFKHRRRGAAHETGDGALTPPSQAADVTAPADHPPSAAAPLDKAELIKRAEFHASRGREVFDKWINGFCDDEQRAALQEQMEDLLAFADKTDEATAEMPL
jgi:hypothetical protein